ncbi:MAG TPA: hypothetical protein VF173_08085 [Thermoanaerobaculia bacterium]|nr:hypothetical protein [Thermoanaerobaculia bacterium]
MSRTTHLVLASVTAFFLLFPLTLGKPGLPTHLKADEAGYYLASLSLAHDRDLRVEPKDVDRAFQEFHYGPTGNLILLSDDGWHTVYFGKPYLYSLFAAPFAWKLGANGLVFFNMLMTLAMMWMGYFYLRRFNPPEVAALFSASFFLLSVGFSYVFWLQPEVFNSFSIAACLFFGLPWTDETGLPDRRREVLFAALSGAVLVLAVYNKPMFAAVGLVPLWVYVRDRRWKTAGVWLLGAVVGMAAACGLAVALTGHPSAYLGAKQRQGVTLCEPGKVPLTPEAAQAPGPPPTAAPATAITTAIIAAPASSSSSTVAVKAPASVDPVASSTTSNSWTWLIRKPDITLYELAENVEYFLVGRHTGMLVYTPFAGLAVLFFLLAGRGRRTSERWLLLGVLAAVALSFLVFIAWNWQGGGGFVGNRYFISAIPAFLFLVTEIRPRWLVLLGHVAAGLFLGPLLFTPFGAAVPEPTLQAHVRSLPFRFLPLELSLKNVPGYERVPLGDFRIVGRKDVFVPIGDPMWVAGAARVELYLIGEHPMEKAVFQVTSLAPNNRIGLALGGQRQVLDFGPEPDSRRVVFEGLKPYRVRRQTFATFWVYRLVVTSRTGSIQHWTREYPPNSCPYYVQDDKSSENFFAGAGISYLGTGALLDADVYGIEWGKTEAPPQVHPGEKFFLITRLINRSAHPWTAEGSARVNLAYHWLDESGKVLEKDGQRTPLPWPVPPGGPVEVRQKVIAPKTPGRYVLELDPVFETVAWFAEKNGGKTLRIPIEVLPAGANPAPPAPAAPENAGAR